MPQPLSLEYLNCLAVAARDKNVESIEFLTLNGSTTGWTGQRTIASLKASVVSNVLKTHRLTNSYLKLFALFESKSSVTNHIIRESS